ncbi:uncharacterized protein LOC117178548 [Belonocnema kinseyi]|uniref:uncharacterized protein LOC117178548 n=1 Tax=Belonocnema kinseyi TaxID=2817044 RepID=UPI00143DBF3D|nr:uncharacterized protein LOC117178548 [Belonocnema kinseyi]
MAFEALKWWTYGSIKLKLPEIKVLNIRIARHGDRTPDGKTEGYPNDPYANQNFDGKLTMSGKKRELAFGNFLRTRYNAFLGPNYIPGSIDARSTDVNRTKESIGLILKGLMPSAVVPTTFDSILKDVMLVPYMCPGYINDYIKARRDTKDEYKMLKGFRKHLRTWTGKKIKSSLNMYRIYTTLECEKFMNLKLPSWTEGVYPDGDLFKGTLLEFDRMNYSKSMRRRNGGRLIRKCKEDMDSVKQGFIDINRKMIIYGTHDLNIVAVLKALGVFFPHVPKFSSAVILELYSMNKPHEVYYVKIARHGDRTPEQKTEGYPNDPYKKQNFDGKLTTSGKKRELDLGKFLRTKYNAFLGPKYISGSIDARSTDVNRTKESLGLILNGLMPKAVVPTKFDSKLKDAMLLPYMCPGYAREYIEAKRDTKKDLKKLEGFMQKLSKWTGKKIKSSLDMYRIYVTLECEKFMNLKLPSWTKGVYPDGDLYKGTLLEFDRMNHSKSMRRRNGGRLLKKCKEDMDSVANGQMDKNRKMIIYGAHDLNILALLKSLGVFFPHVPKFSSAVIIELHHINKPREGYYVKVNYYLGIPPEMKTLKIPGCETLCRFDLFTTLMKDAMPHSEYFVCDNGRKVLDSIEKTASSAGRSVNYYLGIPPKMKTLQIPNCETLCRFVQFTTLMKDIMPHSEYSVCDNGRKVLNAITKTASTLGHSVKEALSK